MPASQSRVAGVTLRRAWTGAWGPQLGWRRCSLPCRVKIMECVDQLNKLLDVDEPWTWIVHDPSGLSEFSDMEPITVEEVAAEDA